MDYMDLACPLYPEKPLNLITHSLHLSQIWMSGLSRVNTETIFEKKNSHWNRISHKKRLNFYNIPKGSVIHLC